MSKPNKLTPGSNLMWESSRMMLPEHKNRLVEHRHELQRRERIELDESELERIGKMMAQSIAERTLLRIQLYDEYGEGDPLIGVVDRMDQQRGRFLVGGRWYDVRHIEGVEEE